MSRLTKEQRATLLSGLTARVNTFPRANLQGKLKAADEAYHLAKVDGVLNTKDQDDEQNYSRFEELTNGLVRENIETFASTYETTYLGNSTLFAMTSTSQQKEMAEKFNTIMSDQQRRMSWDANLKSVFLDVAKYNLCMAEVSWDSQVNYALSFDTQAAAKTTEPNGTKTKQVWQGNAIKHCDMYNTYFDTSVSPDKLNAEGEWAGYTELYTQVKLKTLIDKLKSRSGTIYLTNSEDKEFNIYQVSKSYQSSANVSEGMHYVEPRITTLGQESTSIDKKTTDWQSHFGFAKEKREMITNQYEVSKFVIRVVPSAWSLPGSTEDDIQIWTVYVLQGGWVLYTELMDNIHDRLGFALAQTDSDSLGYNTTGPAQIAIPYMKTAKQMMDRVLAGADRAIGDRAIFDGEMLDKDHVNSTIPDAKIQTKKTLRKDKRLSDYYYSIPYDNNATRGLLTEKAAVEEAGRVAAGLNKPQTGQFQKGNKTLYEYQDVMGNSGDRTFIRTLALEATLMADIKWMIKLNIIQYQKTATLLNIEQQKTVEINPAELYKATVEFKLADGLMPTEYQMSPQVQQLVLQMLGTQPQLFEGWDVPGLVAHLLSQSNGIQISQYLPATPAGGPAPGAV